MASGESQARPPKPRLTLRVGITGKRAIPQVERDRIRKSLGEVFKTLTRLLVDCQANDPDFFSKQLPLLRVISGMAEGADQLAVEVAIERYECERKTGEKKIETRVAAILPFAREEYTEDFKLDPFRKQGPMRTAEEAKPVVDRFVELLDHPAVEAVLQIDNEALPKAASLNPDLSKDDPNRKIRDQAYTDLRDLLLEHSDLLVAVSDDKFGGVGGTVDVIGIAVGLNIPVIKISTLKPEIFVMKAAETDAPDRTPVEDEENAIKSGEAPPKSLVEFFNVIAPSQNPKPEQVAAGEHGEAEEEVRPVRKRLSDFFAEDFRTAGFARIFKSFRDALKVERTEHESVYAKAFAAFRTTWAAYQIKTPEQTAKEMWPDRYDAFTEDKGARARDILAKRYGWADSLAVAYADMTRSSHIAIALLGAVAVLVGLLTLVLWPDHDHAVWIKIVALLLEAAFLLAAARYFFGPAMGERWHERMVEYRAVAELLRHERFIYALGSADRPGRTADRVWGEPDAWVGWYVRAALREAGFPRKVFDAKARRDVLEAFLNDEIGGEWGQIAYNKGQAENFHRIDRRLEKLVRIAFWLTVVIAIAGAALLLGLKFMEMKHVHWCEISAHEAIHFIKPYFVVILAFVPALIAAIHGIRFQIEFRSTAVRAEATMRELLVVQEEAEKALAAPAPAPGRKQSVQLVRMANEAMSADVAGWSNFYRGRGPELG